MILYLDTSSLAKVYVTEPGSDDVRSLIERAELVATSQIAYPELRAALARRYRERTLRPRDLTASKHALDADWPSYVSIDVTASLCRDAGELAERYRLRGFDSVHLASFAEVLRTVGAEDVQFSSFDDRLNRAARALARRRPR